MRVPSKDTRHMMEVVRTVAAICAATGNMATLIILIFFK